MRFSNKGLIKIILPLMAQQALSVMVGLVDSIMVASAGDAAVSGVSLIYDICHRKRFERHDIPVPAPSHGPAGAERSWATSTTAMLHGISRHRITPKSHR